MFSSTRILRTYSTTIGDGLRTLFSRQVDIRPSRPLRGIAERRCLLAALQRFGEVATFLPVKNDSNSKILAIFDTAEAASKAINASPLTISLPSSPIQSTHTNPTFADDNTNVDRFSSVVECKIVHCIKTGTEHEKMIQGNSWKNDTNSHLREEDKIDGIKQDPRIADIIAAGIPRREFADCLINDLALEGGRANGDEVGKEREQLRRKQQEELIAKGSLMVLLEN